MDKDNKIRLDDLLLELGFFDSKQKAQTCIMTNGVSIAGQLQNKAGKAINIRRFYDAYDKDNDYIQVNDKMLRYVSRGAYKLKEAHEKFNLDFQDKVILDIGASTGGFCDYALEQGAKKLFALDVGKGQLHYKLQQEPRLINLEERNFRTWDINEIENEITEPLAFVVTDVSFISLVTILERLKELIDNYSKFFADDFKIVALLKPQFEAGKEIMDKCQGVIKDEAICQKVCQETKTKIQNLGYQIQAETISPITGAKGNKEYLLLLNI